MTKFEKCLEHLDHYGLMRIEELMCVAECSRTVANFALQAFKYYLKRED